MNKSHDRRTLFGSCAKSASYVHTLLVRNSGFFFWKIFFRGIFDVYVTRYVAERFLFKCNKKVIKSFVRTSFVRITDEHHKLVTPDVSCRGYVRTILLL